MQLNLTLKEVVRAKVLKLLNVDIINHILESSWVSPIHAAHKREIITIEKNGNNELLPMEFALIIESLIMLKGKLTFHYPFINQMCEQMASHYHYFFLNGTRDVLRVRLR